MNKLTKFSRAILSVAMVLVVGFPTLAYDFYVDGIYYSYEDKTAKTVQVVNINTYMDSPEYYGGRVTIPSSVVYDNETYSIVSISERAFLDCTNLEYLTIESGSEPLLIYPLYENIEQEYPETGYVDHYTNYYSAFRNCNLKYLYIHRNIDSGYGYGWYPDKCPPFKDITTLTSVTIGKSVTEIGSDAFLGCTGLTEVNFNAENCTSMRSIFEDRTALKTINIGNSVKIIPEYAFKGCTGLTEITIPNSVIEIGNSAFYNCTGLTKVNISDLSAWCNIDFSNSTSNPLYNAHKLNLNGSEINSLVIPNNISQIKKYTFSGFSGMTSVTIGDSVTEIGSSAFSGCTGLTSIISLNPIPPTCESNAFSSDTQTNATLYVQKDYYAKYLLASTWKEFANIKKIETEVSSVKLDSATIYLRIGESQGLTPTFTPANATMTIVLWESDNPAVATIDQNGNVTAISGGKANIIVKTIDGSNIADTCVVSVGLVQSITLSQNEIILPVNDITTLSYTILPEDALNKKATWATSDSSIAGIKVNSDGSVMVVGVADGVATVTATANDDSGLSASCKVKVGVPKVASIALDYSSAQLQYGDSLTITSIVLPEEAYNKAVTWSSSDETIASVKDNGDGSATIIAKNAGNATITVVSVDNSELLATCEVTVLEKIVNYLTAQDVEVSSDTSFTLPIELINEDEITGFQCDVYLPEGIEFEIVDDEYNISFADRATSSHTLSSALQNDGSVRVLAYSTSSKVFEGNSGTLFNINLTTAETFEEDVQIVVKNIVMTTPAEIEYKPMDLTITVSKRKYILGDTNNDGAINVTDVVRIANYVLGNEPAEFIFEAADIKADGVINVSDIVGVSNLILNGSTAKTMSVKSSQKTIVNNANISLEDFVMLPGESKEIEISLNNAEAYTALQFDVKLPMGLNVEKAILNKATASHVMMANDLSNGNMRILSYSTQNANFKSTDESLLTLTIKADENFNGGEIVLSDILAVENNMTETYINDVVATATAPSGVENIYYNPNIYTESRNIIINSAQKGIVSISTIDGIARVAEINIGKNVIPVNNAGLYIVSTESETKKLIIK